MKLLRMKPGHGEIVLAEGDVEVAEEERELIEAFRRELDAGMWAAVPTETTDGRREAEMVQELRRGAARRRARDLLSRGGGAGGSAPPRWRASRPQLWLLGLATAALVLAALVWELTWPSLRAGFTRARARVRSAGVAERRPRRAAGHASWTTTRAASVAPSSARARCCARA